MPEFKKYKLFDDETGETVVVGFGHPPTQDEIHKIFEEQRKAKEPESKAWNALEKVGNWLETGGPAAVGAYTGMDRPEVKFFPSSTGGAASEGMGLVQGLKSSPLMQAGTSLKDWIANKIGSIPPGGIKPPTPEYTFRSPTPIPKPPGPIQAEFVPESTVSPPTDIDVPFRTIPAPEVRVTPPPAVPKLLRGRVSRAGFARATKSKDIPVKPPGPGFARTTPPEEAPMATSPEPSAANPELERILGEMQRRKEIQEMGIYSVRSEIPPRGMLVGPGVKSEIKVSPPKQIERTSDFTSPKPGIIEYRPTERAEPPWNEIEILKETKAALEARKIPTRTAPSSRTVRWKSPRTGPWTNPYPPKP